MNISHHNYCFLYISLSTQYLKYTHIHTHETTPNIQMPLNYGESDPNISEEQVPFHMDITPSSAVHSNPLSTLCLHPGSLYSDASSQSCPDTSTSMCKRVPVVIPMALYVSHSITHSALPKQKLLKSCFSNMQYEKMEMERSSS